MQLATDATIAGDFANARLAYSGVTSTSLRRGGKFVVCTDGHDGALHEYEIKYTFGVEPLQQYLIEFPDGRLQALHRLGHAPEGAGRSALVPSLSRAARDVPG